MLVLRRQNVIYAAIYAILYCILDMQMSSEHSANSSVRATCSLAVKPDLHCTHSRGVAYRGNRGITLCRRAHSPRFHTTRAQPLCSLQTKNRPCDSQ